MPVINGNDLHASRVAGADHGATVSLILAYSEPGQGPRLHRHPYDETWVVQEGNLTFELGGDQCHAGPGDIVIVPPGASHKFTSQGPGPSKLVCIHASPTFQTEWLE